MLLDALAAEPLAEIKFASEVAGIEMRPDDVRLILPGGKALTFPWLVAADGAGSAIDASFRSEQLVRVRWDTFST